MQKVLNGSESKIFLTKKHQQEKGHPFDLTCVACEAKVSDHKQLKILTPQKMLQRLPIALAQTKAGNTSENLLNEIRQIIYYSYRAKEISKKYKTL